MHQVGAGVLGPVFRAYDPEHDRAVAIKSFPLDLTPERARELAEDLGRLTAIPLSHPSIIAPFGAGAEGSTAYLVEEYFVAESADVALKQYGPAPVPDAVRLVGQLAGALDAAAAAGVCHGALHPRDILVAPHEVRLTGLGISPALERVGFHPPVRRPYAAPERVAGGPATASADIFSLACVAFELVTGRRPALSGDTVAADTSGIQAADADALAEVFGRAMSARAEDRHPSALAFAAALKHALTGEPLLAPAEVERPRSRRTPKARKTPPPLPLEPAVAAEPPVDLPLALPSTPAPGSTPLPAFLEAYQGEPSAEPDPRDEPTAALPVDSAIDRQVIPIPEPAPAVPDLPVEAPRAVPVATEEPLALRLEKQFGPAVPEPPTARTDERANSGAGQPPAPAPQGPMSASWAPLLGMLIVGVLIGFVAGYIVAPRGQNREAIVPPPANSAPQSQPAAAPAPAPAPTRADVRPPQAEPTSGAAAPSAPPASGGIEASRQPPVPPAVTPAPARPSAPAKTPARQRRLARPSAASAAPVRKAAAPPRSTVFEGSLSIESKPAGASITLDGRPVGATPLTLPKVSAGSHVVRLELAGHAVWSSAVQVSAGQRNRVTASLERRPGG